MASGDASPEAFGGDNTGGAATGATCHRRSSYGTLVGPVVTGDCSWVTGAVSVGENVGARPVAVGVSRCVSRLGTPPGDQCQGSARKDRNGEPGVREPFLEPAGHLSPRVDLDLDGTVVGAHLDGCAAVVQQNVERDLEAEVPAPLRSHVPRPLDVPIRDKSTAAVVLAHALDVEVRTGQGRLDVRADHRGIDRRPPSARKFGRRRGRGAVRDPDGHPLSLTDPHRLGCAVRDRAFAQQPALLVEQFLPAITRLVV